MKRSMTLLVVLIGSLGLTTGAIADDKADVKAAAEGILAAFGAGDVDAYAQYFLTESSHFVANGGLLQYVRFTDEKKTQRKAQIEAAKEAGEKLNAEWRHLDVQVYDNTAVSTGYEVITRTRADGTTNQVPLRTSIVWVKQNDKWKAAHFHLSRLLPPQ